MVTFFLMSSNCDVYFSNNNTYDSLNSRCKECRLLVKKVTNKLNDLAPPIVNGLKFKNINIISRNPVKSNQNIHRLRSLNVTLRRKIVRLVNNRILKKVCQVIDNVSDASLIKTNYNSKRKCFKCFRFRINRNRIVESLL